MSTFKYHPFPKATAGYTTRPVLSAEIDVTALDAAVSTATGVPADKCVLILQTYLQKILASAGTCGQSTDIHGILRYRPTCGGSEASPDAFHTPDDINADVALSFTSDAIHDWRTTLELESMGVVGKVTPLIDTIIDLADGSSDHYVAGGLIEVIGDNLKFDKNDAAQGVFFKPASGPEVRATVYGSITPGSAIALVPATLTGSLSVRVSSFINGSVRTYTYTNPITN